MNAYQIYDSASGLFTGAALSCDADQLAINVPDGFSCLVGSYDVLSQRVDITSGSVIDYQPPQASADHVWNTATKRWEHIEPLASLQAKSINKPYADIDAVVRDAVGNRTEEYKAAEADARAYRAAGYAGAVPPSVDCFAQHNPTGIVQTGQWAADDIIMRADAFAVAKLAMRQMRFSSQSAMRSATTSAELDAAVAGWTSFIAQIRAQLGL